MKPVTASMLMLSLLAAVPALAYAQSSSHASIGGITLTLIDLDPADGIAPFLEFDNEFARPSNVQARFTDLDAGRTTDLMRYGAEPWTNRAFSFDYRGQGTGTPAQLRGAAQITGSSLTTIELLADSAASGGTKPDSLAAGNAGTSFRSFYLSPMTRLSVSFDLAASSRIATAGRGHAQAWAAAYFTVLDQPGAWDMTEFRLFSSTAAGAGTGSDLQETFRFDYDSGHAPVDLNLDLQLHAISYTGVPTPVPEPASYAMLLGGLCLLGHAARRRKGLSEAAAATVGAPGIGSTV